MNKRAEIAAKIKALHDEANPLLDSPTEEGLKRIAEITTEMDACENQLKDLDQADAMKSRIESQKRLLAQPVPGSEVVNPVTEVVDDGMSNGAVKIYKSIPATAVRSRQNVFKDDNGRPDSRKAYAFGTWIMATIGNNARAKAWCQQNGISIRAHSEGNSSAGGFLVPEEFDADIIDLREIYGVFRKYARIRPMKTDTRRIPRRTGGLNAYFEGESQALVESTKSWDAITLIARKLIALTKISSELDEDAAVDIGADLAREIAYTFAKKEDNCGFNGDGTSTYGGIVGVTQALLNLSGTIANIAGLNRATGTGYGTNWNSITLNDFSKTKGLLPAFARTEKTAWFCHQTFYDTVMEPIKLAAGGVTEQMIANGSAQMRMLGYPVVVSQIMPSTSAINQVPVVFGDLSLGVELGDRRQTTLAMSTEAGFATDEIWIRGTERFDVNVHDVGNASATASLRVTGPVVGLVTGAS